MSEKPIVVVTGATGSQGGGVVDSLLKLHPGKYHIRALTRDPKSASSQALAAKGVEVVAATFDDPESLRSAFKNAWALFANTNFWDPSVGSVPGKEEEQGKRIADIAKETGVKYVIYSSLDDVAKESKGKYTKVEHFDGKNHVEQYIKQSGLNGIFVYPGFYTSNFSSMFPPRPDDSGVLTWTLPFPETAVLPIVDITPQTGDVVAAVLENPDAYVGKRIDIAPSYVALKDIPKIFTEVTGVPAKYQYVPLDTWKTFLPAGMPHLEELVQMLAWQIDFGYYGGRELTGLPAGVKGYGWKEWLLKSGYKG